MYKATYKCRMCGETFTGKELEHFGCAEMIMEDLATDDNKCSPRDKIETRVKEIHYCSDGSIGYADFVGFRKENDNA